MKKDLPILEKYFFLTFGGSNLYGFGEDLYITDDLTLLAIAPNGEKQAFLIWLELRIADSAQFVVRHFIPSDQPNFK
jgi:hypothetical protein